MAVRKLKDRIFEVGAIDWDRELFDELVHLPDGTSYNAYLVQGSEKTALIDTVDPDKEQVLIQNLKTLHPERIDYLISNHAEQDHSGCIPKILELHPETMVVTNAKCKAMLIDHLRVPEDRFIVIKDRETLSLGDKTLEFIMTPWVHWPETMTTYLREDKILFPCDFFGAHRAASNLFVTKESKVYYGAKRYYAEIMMPFRTIIKKHLKVLEGYDIEMIAPSHGPVYDRPAFIMDAYRDWVSDEVKNKVLIPFVSMHGSTRKMVDHLTGALIDRGIKVKLFNLVKADMGEYAMDIVDAATVIFATPFVLVGAHPSLVYAAYFTGALRAKVKHVGIMASYGWGGKVVEQVKSLIEPVKAEHLEPVLSKGLPGEEDFRKVDALADTILERHQALNIL